MKMRKIAAIAAAVALVGSGLMFAAPAFADDPAPPPEEAVTQVEEAVAAPAEEVATEEPVAEPVVEEGPAEEAPATEEAKPAAEQAVVTPQGGYETKVWVCKYSGTPGVDEKFKEGKNPIDVSVNTLKDFPGTFPWQFPDAQGRSIAIAWSDQDVTIEDCPAPEVPQVTNVCPGVIQGDTSTNISALWTNVDTRSAGHYEYVDGGLHVWTDDNSSQAKVSLGRALSFPLKNTGTLGLDWTGTTPPPGINLFVTFEDGKTGTLVYESVYGQDLWLTNGSNADVKANAPVIGGGNGSQWHGTIDQWLTKYPNAQVNGFAFALGSGVLGDGVINSITVGCTTFYFDYEEEVVEYPVPALFNAPTAEPTCAVGAQFNEGFLGEPVDSGEGWATYEFENIFVQVDRSVDGEVTFYIWPKDGYELTNLDGWTEDSDEQGTYWYRTIVLEGPLGYQSEDPEAVCYQVPQPAAPTWFENCGTDNDTWVVPGNTDEFYYEVTEEGSTVTITANLRSETSEWAPGVTTSWSHTFTDEECPVTPTPEPSTPPLAATGGGGMSPLIPLGGGTAVMLGLVLGAIGYLRRRMA